MIAPYILHEVQHAIQNIEGFAGGGNLSSLQSEENITAKEAYDYYRKIAGEVEARNVSARINMTPEERRATLLSETEDVAREDQIFLREGVMQGQPKFSLAGTEVGFILKNYDNIQDIATAVEAVVKRYPKDSVMLANVLSDYRQNADDDEFIQGLRTFAKYFEDKQERDRSEDKVTIEETFGGIWIEDTEEFAKFVSAVNNSPFEEDGEGIAYTDNYFYAYYRNINGEPVPYASVYMNEALSQDIVKKVIKELNDVRTSGRVKERIDSALERIRDVQSQDNANDGYNSGASSRRRNERLGFDILRKGRYFDNPSLYVKTPRTDRRRDVNYSLSDIPFFDAEGNAIDMSAISEAKALEMIDGRVRDMSERADYQELLAETPAVMEVLSREELDSCFTLEYYLKNVDFIFDRVGIE